MSTIHRFMFDNSFDDGQGPPATPPEPELVEPEPPPEPPPPPPEPTFTLSEVQEQVRAAAEQTRQQAYEEGRQAGRQEVETQAAHALTEALNRVDAHLQHLIQAEQQSRALRAENTRRIALAIVRKLFPAYVRRHGQAEVEAVIAAFLTELSDETKLIIRVHENWLDTMRGHIEGMAQRLGFAGHVTLLADPRLGDLDVRVDWGDGGAERDATALWTEIERIAGDLLRDFPDGPASSGAAAPSPLIPAGA